MLSWIVFIIIISAPPTVVTGKQRAINWWWVGDNPNMDTKPFLDFVTKHKNIGTSYCTGRKICSDCKSFRTVV